MTSNKFYKKYFYLLFVICFNFCTFATEKQLTFYGNHLFKSVRPCQWDLLLCRLLSLEDKGTCGAAQGKDFLRCTLSTEEGKPSIYSRTT